MNGPDKGEGSIQTNKAFTKDKTKTSPSEK